jgi:uncharacterized protein YdaU (DUF1376 family)
LSVETKVWGYALIILIRGQQQLDPGSMNYYPHHIGDYLRDTSHLSALEDGIYRRMLDLYYASEKPLPLNISGLCRLVRARSREEKVAVDTILEEFFVRRANGFSQRRAEAEIAKAQEKSGKAKASANMRWHCDGNANALRSGCEGNAPNNQYPITNNQEPKKEQRQQRSRGSRLPPDWQPSELLKAWAAKERTDLNLAQTVEKFKDHWTAAPGSKGVKLDWEATFRNWVRAERPGARSAVPDYSAVMEKIRD